MYGGEHPHASGTREVVEMAGGAKLPDGEAAMTAPGVVNGKAFGRFWEEKWPRETWASSRPECRARLARTRWLQGTRTESGAGSRRSGRTCPGPAHRRPRAGGSYRWSRTCRAHDGS